MPGNEASSGGISLHSNIAIAFKVSMIGAESICIESAIWVSGNGRGLFVIATKNYKPLQPNVLQEDFGDAYIRAIVSCADFTFNKCPKDVNSIDFYIDSDFLISKSSKDSAQIAVQAKTTKLSRLTIKQDEFIYHDLPSHNYFDLIMDKQKAHILILVILPDEKDDWLKQTTNELVTKKCGYWCNLRGFPKLKDPPKNVSVPIKKTNVFSVEALKTLMLRQSKGEELGYEI